jgi:dienelactone hydrolase
MNAPTIDGQLAFMPELPKVLQLLCGSMVQDTSQWRVRRREILEILEKIVYGPLPPVPNLTKCVELHTSITKNLANARLDTYRVEVDGQHAFLLRVLTPQGPGPYPVILNGDGCWHYANDRVIEEILARGYGFAQFNRVEIAPDSRPVAVSPRPFGAIAAWAWGYHRAVDALLQLDFIDHDCIAVVGHSRGGKAALLAGATDERIALTSANNSGAAGAGSFLHQGLDSETLADIVVAFPHWLSPKLNAFANREHELAFDQHFLKSLVAPRALLTTEALDDLWANPTGTYRTHLAAQEVYKLLSAPGRIAISYRVGGHDHSFADWGVLLDFADAVFRGADFSPPPIPAPILHPPAGFAR